MEQRSARAEIRAVCIAVCLTVVAAACTGSGEQTKGRVTTAGKPAAAASGASSPLSSAKQMRSARMISGTDSMLGTLALWCEGDDCRRAPGAAPKRYIEAVPGGVLMFAVGAEPQAARVVIRDRGKDVAAQGALHPGTTMAFRGELSPGRYVVTLVAQFEGREARWVFGVVRRSG